MKNAHFFPKSDAVCDKFCTQIQLQLKLKNQKL
jgi:hypothetical protein